MLEENREPLLKALVTTLLRGFGFPEKS